MNRSYTLNYKCNDCGAKWATRMDQDYCPKCLKNNITTVSRNGGPSAYDLSSR